MWFDIINIFFFLTILPHKWECRPLLNCGASHFVTFILLLPFSVAAVSVRGKHVQETDEAFDTRYECFFNRPDIDGWEIRKAMNDLQVRIISQ